MTLEAIATREKQWWHEKGVDLDRLYAEAQEKNVDFINLLRQKGLI